MMDTKHIKIVSNSLKLAQIFAAKKNINNPNEEILIESGKDTGRDITTIFSRFKVYIFEMRIKRGTII